MRSCVWLKPELVAQIEFTEWTPDGHLRHSKFVGLRDDKESQARLCAMNKNEVAQILCVRLTDTPVLDFVAFGGSDSF